MHPNEKCLPINVKTELQTKVYDEQLCVKAYTLRNIPIRLLLENKKNTPK